MNRYLGIDHGDVRIGVAMSDELGFMAHPLETIDVRRTPAVPRIKELVEKHAIATVIIGLPRNMDGSRGPAAEKATAFAALVRAEVTCPVIPWDERLTTVSAQRELRASGRKAHEQKDIIDQAAAQLILQGWLDSQSGGLF